MRRQKRWRVRVRRVTEEWLEIQSDTAAQANAIAINRPGVVSVMAELTISGEKPVNQVNTMGVEDGDD